MIKNIDKKAKIEFGDFQTPIELAEKVCQQLIQLNVSPDVIVEPTCGVGSFIDAASLRFPLANKIIGIEINAQYLQEVRNKNQYSQDQRIELIHKDFFEVDWRSYIKQLSGEILVLGNFPWVTNAQQGIISSDNLPQKNNFQKHNGLDAITGKSNFDVSEWMLIQIVQCLQGHNACLAMLCKTSVSRKILNYIYSQNLNLTYCASYKIDAQKYFGATVDACLLFCQFDQSSKNYFCDVFNDLDQSEYKRIEYRNNILIRDVISFEKFSSLYDKNPKNKWRSGIKHDCSKIMEFRKIDGAFVNGLGESIDIEEIYLFPLIKGSDIAQNRVETTDRYVLVTQKFVGESTEYIKLAAPKTWGYLESHSMYLSNRKSKIYQKNPKFSIFGVGKYTFASWKIAICGLYKKLEFRLISNLDNKPTVFDDTVYFLSFSEEKVAIATFKLLTSDQVISFYSSQIFWDEKRPIKSSILNSLNLSALLEANK
ncbi:SAM-dependent methyltransferase [Pseudanabaena sp. UWO310]|uniref:SAM-dependent methyltransferase n=1 Tax=Pseudanabaena sp. UWO310 TaxID=2480795 RepID=UPI0016815852|nr:SAM-dependent methyltransferase [Pseudanabaena sp. UWO310]